MRRLPPLLSIRAFEAAARLGSFTRAAQELAMTQSGISYQVRLLEGYVQGPLFSKQGRGGGADASGRAPGAGAFTGLR